MSIRGKINVASQGEFILARNDVGFAKVKPLLGREGTSLQWEMHGFLSLWISPLFCLPTIAYLCRGNGFCDAWGKVCSTVTAFCQKSLHCCTLFVRSVQTLHTHAEQSCSRKMSAYHNWEITNKSVHPDWLLEKMEGWIIQLWFLSKYFSNQNVPVFLLYY